MRGLEPEVWTKWRGLVSEQTESGQSAARFCRERGLPVWQFYDWKKRLVEGEVAKFVSVEVKPAQLAVSSSAPGDKAIEIRRRRGCRLVVEPGLRATYAPCWRCWRARDDWSSEPACAGWIAGSADMAGRRGDRYALRLRSVGRASPRGHWSGSSGRASVRVPLTPGRQIEDSSLGSRWVCSYTSHPEEKTTAYDRDRTHSKLKTCSGGSNYS